MAKFKKIYVEITNSCNLKCSFCSKSSRKKREISPIEFQHIINQIKPYTDYIYLHIKGEPLLHSQLGEILDICSKALIKVNITTNGTLLKEKGSILKRADCIRQINISLHSENNKRDYLSEIFETVSTLPKSISVVYRFWVLKNLTLDLKSTEIVDKLQKYYNLSTLLVDKIKKEKNIHILDNLYVNKADLFEWPEEQVSDIESSNGYCLGGKTHVGILSDGTVVPCCLDGEGQIPLGNIFQTNFKDILEAKRYTDLVTGFKNRKVTEELCKNCTFRNRFDL
ncbi:MAG: radical SAM/SPASM domain-containing protein [Bacilli bacterium]